MQVKFPVKPGMTLGIGPEEEVNETWTLMPIHRHQKTSETVVCLRGRLVWEFYDELERICTERVGLSPGGAVVALNVPAGQWHTVKALESGSVILEMKDGGYEPIGPEEEGDGPTE